MFKKAFASLILAAIAGQVSLMAASFEVVKAEYGANSEWKDVTQNVVAAVSGDSLKIAASNDNFGDPAPGVQKSLKVVFKYNGKLVELSAPEGETLLADKAALDKAPAAKNVSTVAKKGLEIVKAEYGANGAWKDVTDIVKQKIGPDGKIDADNSLFGDPAPGVGKALKVTVKLDGRLSLISCDERAALTVNEDAARKAPEVAAPQAAASKTASKIEIVKAEYGVGSTWADVTAKVKELVGSGLSSIDATNDNFGDPVEGTAKTLKIKYKADGKEIEKSAGENGSISL